MESNRSAPFNPVQGRPQSTIDLSTSAYLVCTTALCLATAFHGLTVTSAARIFIVSHPKFGSWIISKKYKKLSFFTGAFL
jgi:hypothetical protein